MKQPFKVGETVWFIDEYGCVDKGLLHMVKFDTDTWIYEVKSLDTVRSSPCQTSYVFHTSGELLDFIKKQIKDFEK